MTFEYDDKGKIFTDIISKIAVPAVIQTSQHQIHGNIHVRRDERLKDELDRDEIFLAVTDASVVGAEGQEIHKSRFLAVRRAHIVWVMPADEVEESGQS